MIIYYYSRDWQARLLNPDENAQEIVSRSISEKSILSGNSIIICPLTGTSCLI